MKNIMFFDPAVSGHHSEYIRHIVKYIHKKKYVGDFYFVVNQNFTQIFPDIKVLADCSTSIKIIEITTDEYSIIYSVGSNVKRSIREFRIMNSYALAFNIDHCVLLHINSFQLAIGLYQTKYTISGILFGQYTWQVFQNNFKGWIYRKRKKAQTRWMIRNKKIKAIFLLNDHKSCGQLNKIYDTNVFKYLPDPVIESTPEPSFDLRTKYNIARDHKIYLQVGSLDSRKGTLEIIDSVKYLDEVVRLNICIIIMGKAPDAFDLLIKHKINEINTSFKVNIIYENAYISDSMLKGMLEQTDFILIPYKNTEASSGMLGHAIVNRKLLIGPKLGLLGYLIEENKLGYLLDSVDSVSISRAITDFFCTQDTVDSVDEIRSAYMNSHSGDIFADVILSNL